MNSTLFALFVSISASAIAHASPPPADSVHFCAFDERQQWRRDHPRPAGKGLADLDVGEPRTVRMIYFLPNDMPFRQEVVDLMKVRIRQVQTFYGEQMKGHGYGDRTLRIENDALGEPLVHRVDGQHPGSYYHEPLVIRDEIRMFDLQENIYFIVVDAGFSQIGGVGSRYNKNGGFALVGASVSFTTVAHELGHAFGLDHDYRDGAYIMSYGPGQNQLSACAAEFLAVHPYFNPNSPIHETLPPTVELISPRTYPAGSESVSIRLRVGDSEGLHQVILYASSRDLPVGARGFPEVKACRGLSGERDAVVEFEYDGSIPSSSFSSLSDPIVHPIRVRVVDTGGDESWKDFILSEISSYHIATLEGHTDGVWAMAVSPDGGILASGAATLDESRDTTVRLWDVASREEIATLKGHTGGAYSVAFSPDGALLAAGSRDGTILLWDVANRTKVGSLNGHRHGVRALAFSRDGTLLASGATDFTVRLWDVASRKGIGILKEYSFWVTSVAFSPDGAFLATGSYDGVELWDVASRTEIGSLSKDGVRSVGFSPDGTLLATGMLDDTVRLWDVASRTEVGIIKEHTDDVTSVAFSRDGTLLASGSADGMVILWDVLSGQKIVAFPSTGRVRSVVFLGDDATLASGSDDGSIALWDVSQWSGPRPYALEIISGDGQQGEPGAALAQPLVVEVRDQNGNPLAGAQVTFAVTAGGGTLSATTATTDADGRALTTLTLGRTPGTTTVRATVADLEPVTFTATGLAVPRTLAKLSGDEQQAAAGAQLAEPLVVSVRDQNAAALPGAVVTFAVLGDGGTLSAAVDTTDAEGLAGTTLTLGEELGTYRVEVSVADLQPVTFTASAEATPDFDGDGETGFSDFFLFAEAFGGSDPRFDLDGSGTVDFADFFLFAESFGQPERAKLLALAREQIGLPDGPQLQQNAPNPFNSGTVISWFQLQSGPTRLEVFALTGQRVAMLHDGPQKAGLHRLRWDARDDQGRPLASGVYVYRLVTAENVQTRKLTLLR